MKLALRRASIASPGARDARRAWPARELLWLRLTDAAGHSGLGEAAPLPGYSSERLDDVEAWLGAFDPNRLAPALESSSVRTALLQASALTPPMLPSARMALETAVLDLLGRRLQQPAHVLLGADGGARPLSALLGPADAPGLVAEAQSAFDGGYRTFKLKLGAPGRLAAELDGVRRLREALGPEPALRLDANRSLGADDLARAWPALQALGVELFEEPGPNALPQELPLALDESLQGLSPADAVLRAQRASARALVLKPMALGGLAHCLVLADAAERTGLGVVVSHCFDGPGGFAAAAALALALPLGAAGAFAHGLAPHAALGAWAAPVKAGMLCAWSEPGLGLDPGDGAP